MNIGPGLKGQLVNNVNGVNVQSIIEQFQDQKFDEVIARSILELQGDCAHTQSSRITFHLLIALSYKSIGRDDLCIERFKLAVQIFPKSDSLLYNYAVVLAETGQENLALSMYLNCLRYFPMHIDALWNAGELLRLDGQFEAAIECFQRLESQGVERQYLKHRMAVCFAHLGLSDQANEYFNWATLNEPNPTTTWEFALFLLAEKRYELGWVNYRRRFDDGQKINVVCQSFGFPKWDGNYRALEDKTLIVLPEQGLGDQVQFAACISELAQRVNQAGGNLVLVTRGALFDLFKSSFSGLKLDIVPHEIGRDWTGIAAQYGDALEVAIGDLPLFTQYFLPLRQPYLRASDASIQWANSLMERSGGAYRIGLAWGASTEMASPSRKQRDIPIEIFGRFKNLPAEVFKRLEFISLMVGERAAQICKVPELHIQDLSYLIQDFSDTAGLIELCDLVITPCTSIAHVAGAMGKEVLLFSQKDVDWRWRADQAQSDWYQNVHILRQAEKGDWSSCIHKAQEFIGNRLGGVLSD